MIGNFYETPTKNTKKISWKIVWDFDFSLIVKTCVVFM